MTDPYAGSKPMPRAEDLKPAVTAEEARRIIEAQEKEAASMPSMLEIQQNRVRQDGLRFHWRWVIAQEASKIAQAQPISAATLTDYMDRMWDFISEGKFEK